MSSTAITFLTFFGFTTFVAFYSWFKTKQQELKSQEGYFLGGRSLTGVLIAGSMLMTNMSTEHLVGLNGASYKNGFIVIAWEVTSALALIVAAVYFVPRYLRMGLTTIPQYLENRFDSATRTMVALFLMVSFAVTLMPIVLYTGAINLESIFNVSEILGVTKTEGLWITVLIVGVIGSVYAIFGGLKGVAVSDTLYGYGLLFGGLLIPILALVSIGDGNPITGLTTVFKSSPEKFNVIGAPDSVLPFSTLFTGLVINQLYFWCMNQSIIQRSFGAKNLAEAQKGLLYTGVLKILVPAIIVLPGVVGYYYFGDSLYSTQDMVYPELVKKVLPLGLAGFFAAVVMGAVLSTFNGVLNSAATIFSIDVYKRVINKSADDRKLVWIGKLTASILAITSIAAAPFVANASEGLYQLLQQLNGIFFIPIASIILGGFFFPRISATGAKVALLVGMLFYVLTTFVLQVDLHYIHVWGIEFVLNMLIMFLISALFPTQKNFEIKDLKVIDMQEWKYTKAMSIALVIITLTIYVLLSNV